MKRKKLIILVLSVLLVGLISFLLTNTSFSEESYFNQVKLSDNNFITNTEVSTFYDTIISVGLDEVGVSGVNVVVSELSNGAKEKFDYGELKAHVRYFNGTYYLFLDKYDRRESIDIISHEIIHISQYNTGQLIYENGELYWEGEFYDLETLDYDNRPWERDAFSGESNLSSKILKKLYN
jgi:predicted metallopeptidase